MTKQIFYPFIGLYIIVIFYLAYTTPISPHEANIFYTDNGIVSILMHYGYKIFGGLIGIRIFFIIIGIFSIYLYYSMTGIYLDNHKDRQSATVIYLMLPAMITAFVVANISILVIPLVLIFLLAYDKNIIWLEILVMALLFIIHDASVIFFITIFIYGLVNKNKILFISSGFFLVTSIIITRGVEIGGRPSGHFVDIFGLYSAIFTPFIFIYFFYTLYRILLIEEKNILWYISFGALLLSLILSIRQKISITDFAPYVVISVVLMLDSFNKKVRVRLPEYQKYYKIGFKITIGTLLIISSIVMFHHENFASRLYNPYKIAQELKSQNINCYKINKRDKVYQFNFYGIRSCPRYKFKR